MLYTDVDWIFTIQAAINDTSSEDESVNLNKEMNSFEEALLRNEKKVALS